MEEYLEQYDFKLLKNLNKASQKIYDQNPNYHSTTKNLYFSDKFSNSSEEERQKDFYQNQKSSKAINEIFNINNNNNNIQIENNRVFRIEEFTTNNLNNEEKNDSPENIEQNNDSKNENEMNKSNSNSNEYNSGRWSNEEHNKFIEGILKYGNEWKKVQNIIKTRTSTQARSHAQKFFLRLKKVANQEILNDENKLLNYIISSCKKTNNNFNITEEQKEKLMSVIRINLKSEEFLNKSDKDFSSCKIRNNSLNEKNESGLDVSYEKENDFLGYNKQMDNNEFGFQKKMSCDIEEKDREKNFCSKKRKSSCDIINNNSFNKIFNITKDKSNKNSLDLTKNQNNFDNLQSNGDKEKNNNNYNTKKFNINHNFIINKNTSINENINFQKNQTSNKTINTSDFNIKNGNIIIQNNIYNIYNNFNNEITPPKDINNSKCNQNIFIINNNQINSYKNTNLRTVIFNPEIKKVKKDQSQNSENDINENQFDKNDKKLVITNKNFIHISSNQENNYKTIYENEQYDPFNLQFDFFSNDKKMINEYYNFKNNNLNQVNEIIQTYTEKSNNLYM